MRSALAGLLIGLLSTILAPSLRAQDYRIQPGDTLEVTVLEDPVLNRQVLVRPDGRITLPLAGSVVAEGLTPEALSTRVRSAISRDFVTPPTVTVSLISLGEGGTTGADDLATVYILGEIRTPGPYAFEPPLDLLQALALAGGPATFAARDRIQLRRATPNGETVTILDYDLVEDGAVPTNRVAVHDGDVIIVPERGLFD